MHGPGDVQGQPVHLLTPDETGWRDVEFARFIIDCYEVDSVGRRRVNQAFISRSKGRAKSELGGFIGCAEALGPVRFSHRDKEGNPVGRPVMVPYIRIMATEENQAGNVYDVIKYNFDHGPLAEVSGVDSGLTRIILPDGGEITPSTANAASKDGGKETWVCYDETHLWTTPELRRTYSTVRRNLVKRKLAEPWSLETSTMYAPGENSVAEATHEYFQKVSEGLIKDQGVLMDHREAPEVDINNTEALLEALVYVYGSFASVIDLDRIVAEIRNPATEEEDARRYFLNQVVAGSDQWMDRASWQARRDDTDPIRLGDQIAIGFDGSIRNDSTALIGCRLRDGKLFVLGVWEKPDTDDDWEVDFLAVDAAMAAAEKTYRVEWAYCDPAYWQDIVGRWSIEFGTKKIFEFWTNKDGRMVQALERFHTAVITGQLAHDGDATLTRHILNARKRNIRAGTLIRKETPRSKKKIDAAVAAVLAYEARGDAIADGRLKKAKRRVRGF
ncbi:Phage terminase-like protein, large subunit, contains N-terminal HTH domain [Sinosporangium album]|uniref:Phage terminase-like protein, large subunit, contains N-terminal HTH domain n=1 Tax=Sinosporangium album TaxID=504805 RepID=A0A1G8AF29_9ACTN|nr:terminase large subunit [Sinosporangium album]SDH19574.1 Phage terminase-like protein, large subunit, contains N-terminal HTH domain [Sinosporangium album]